MSGGFPATEWIWADGEVVRWQVTMELVPPG